jgi:hypothetical protein
LGQRQRQSARVGRRGQPDTLDLVTRDRDPLVIVTNVERDYS